MFKSPVHLFNLRIKATFVSLWRRNRRPLRGNFHRHASGSARYEKDLSRILCTGPLLRGYRHSIAPAQRRARHSRARSSQSSEPHI